MPSSDSRRSRRSTLLLAAGVIAPGECLAQASQSPGGTTSRSNATGSGASQAPGGDARDYWTPERMRDARPLMPTVRDTPPRSPGPPSAGPGASGPGGVAEPPLPRR